MPMISSERIGVAFDMAGCPNRCRHCWLGMGGNQTLSQTDVRWGVAQFREFIQQADTPIRTLAVSTHFREPDLRDDYRDLYDLETELGDGKPNRFELLSIWRIARDRTYLPWAKSVGPDTCQITFFGMQETTDWFYRRSGAFVDALTATERLLDQGMKPRWQIFLTTKLLPELDDLLALQEKITGSYDEFNVFLNLPGPEGEASKLEHLRPTIDQVSDLPEKLLTTSRRHMNKEILWSTEAELVSEILSAPFLKEERTEDLWFFVCSNWDVYSNIGTLDPWWCLGNLKTDSVETILRRYDNNEVPGLKGLVQFLPESLVKEFGNANGQKIYANRHDLLALYSDKLCKREWGRK